MDNYNRYKANGMRDRFKRKISKPNNNIQILNICSEISQNLFIDIKLNQNSNQQFD